MAVSHASVGAERPFASLLASLHGTALASRFQAWPGASGRRHIVSVFPVDADDPCAGLPAFDRCVVLAARRTGCGHLAVIAVIAIGRASDRRGLAAFVASGATEWHVHFPDPADREWRSRADDLRTALVQRRQAA